jgi:trans-aconitate methyltransferase
MNTTSEEWKNSSLPSKQLDLNLYQLSKKDNYPPHWNSFLDIMKEINTNLTFYDFGCGVGSTYELLNRNNVKINYIGLDFSEAMIECAKKTWGTDNFYIRDFHNTEFEIKNQIIYCNGLLDVLPNGEEALDKILKMNAKYVILNRLNFGEKEMVETYKAYDTITCIKYTFNV